jgi:FAD/FMN-containing dehydrogenase
MVTTLGSMLGERFRGELLEPGAPRYDEARSLWNADIDRRPRLIARCAGVDDVVEAVRGAREAGLPLSVRGGGHGVAGHAIVEDGLVVDLSLLKDVHIDPVRRTVRAGAGVVLGELDGACQRHGLAIPAGIVTHTGISGLTLGGGIGWLMRKHGATVDNLLSARLVTADGRVVTASADAEPELFWGLRGAGANFGAVTSFEYRAHEVGPIVLSGPVSYALEDGADVLRAYRDAVADAPDELMTILTLRNVPSAPPYPEEHHGRPVVNVVACFAGDLERGESVVRPLRELGTPVFDLLEPRPFLEHQRFFDAGVQWGWGYYWKSWELPSLSDGAIDALVEGGARLPTPQSFAIVFQLGGAVARVPDDATAYPQREAAFDVNLNGIWLTEGSREEAIGWVRDTHAALEPHSGGRVYVNFLGDEGQGRVRDAFGAEKYARLVELKDRFDPDNVFRSNQNIRPSRSEK